MTRHPRSTPALLGALVLAVSGGVRAADPPRAGADPPRASADSAHASAGSREAAEGRGELREALRDFYLHRLADELGLSPDESARVVPRVEAVLDAQRQVGAGRLRGLQRLSVLAEGEASERQLREAVEAVTADEVEAQARLARARRQLVGALTPRQAATFFAFQERFRAQVRDIALGRGRAGGPALLDEPGDGLGRDVPGPPRDQGGPPPPAWDEPLGGRPRARLGDAAPGPGPGERERRQRQDEMAGTLELLYVHESRLALARDVAGMLPLLPDLEALFRSRLAARRRAGDAVRDLREGLRNPSTTDADLGRLTEAALAVDDEQARAESQARARVLSALSPAEAVRFLVFENRFDRDARRRLRGGQGAAAERGFGAGPGERAPTRDRPAWRGSGPGGGPGAGRPRR